VIRFLLLSLLFVVLYHGVRILFRSAFRAYHGDAGTGDRSLSGREMVQDPQCRTYIVKERAVLRRIGGTPRYFCCEACADAFVKSHRA
jgi:uncharacterized protein